VKKFFLLIPLPIYILSWLIFVFKYNVGFYLSLSDDTETMLLGLIIISPIFLLIGIIYLLYKKYYLSAICYLIVGGGPFIRLYVVSVLNADFGFNI